MYIGPWQEYQYFKSRSSGPTRVAALESVSRTQPAGSTVLLESTENANSLLQSTRTMTVGGRPSTRAGTSSSVDSNRASHIAQQQLRLEHMRKLYGIGASERSLDSTAASLQSSYSEPAASGSVNLLGSRTPPRSPGGRMVVPQSPFVPDFPRSPGSSAMAAGGHMAGAQHPNRSPLGTPSRLGTGSARSGASAGSGAGSTSEREARLLALLEQQAASNAALAAQLAAQQAVQSRLLAAVDVLLMNAPAAAAAAAAVPSHVYAGAAGYSPTRTAYPSRGSPGQAGLHRTSALQQYGLPHGPGRPGLGSSGPPSAFTSHEAFNGSGQGVGSAPSPPTGTVTGHGHGHATAHRTVAYAGPPGQAAHGAGGYLSYHGLGRGSPQHTGFTPDKLHHNLSELGSDPFAVLADGEPDLLFDSPAAGPGHAYDASALLPVGMDDGAVADDHGASDPPESKARLGVGSPAQASSRGHASPDIQRHADGHHTSPGAKLSLRPGLSPDRLLGAAGSTGCPGLGAGLGQGRLDRDRDGPLHHGSPGGRATAGHSPGKDTRPLGYMSAATALAAAESVVPPPGMLPIGHLSGHTTSSALASSKPATVSDGPGGRPQTEGGSQTGPQGMAGTQSFASEVDRVKALLSRAGRRRPGQAQG